ncbi:cell division cycle protein 123 [Biomphalaria pfeifferi]|uniref:Cell division cycle protein 123 n=1 Tax=Biomphalaria pfeifferi TaxID=112525 RepID=A0AAD8B077_BIOPF|nr:cell division cycle protein 123 [Biomphalaria pfeifferi]
MSGFKIKVLHQINRIKMASFAEQLKAIQLKKNSEPIKDYSSPKLGGFMKQEEIDEYQNNVLDVNIETWFELIKEHSFPSTFLHISSEEAKLFVKIYERHYANLEPEVIAYTNWQNYLSKEEQYVISNLSERLQDKIDQFIEQERGFVFVKLSGRSPKDAPMVQSQFKTIYMQHLMKANPSDRFNENTQIKCLLQANFESLQMSSSQEVLDACLRSERVYQDMLLALAVPERFRENFIIRKFVNFDVDMEFRGFVYNQRLTALSQYNYLIFSERLKNERNFYLKLIQNFFLQFIAPKLEHFVSNYVIDFGVSDNGSQVWVIEINPFLITTDAALFSWEHERHLLESAGEETLFRVIEKPRPGAKAMLPFGMKQLIKTLDLEASIEES